MSSVHLRGVLRWLGYPPGIQAIPMLGALGCLLALLLDWTVGFNESTRLGDWLNLLSAVVLAVPGFAVLDHLYGTDVAKRGATVMATRPGRKALAEAMSDLAEEREAKASGYSVRAVLAAYLGFVLLVASSAGSLWFEASAGAEAARVIGGLGTAGAADAGPSKTPAP